MHSHSQATLTCKLTLMKNMTIATKASENLFSDKNGKADVDAQATAPCHWRICYVLQAQETASSFLSQTWQGKRVKQYNSKRSRFSSLNQKALRRSHAFHGLQQRCGDTIHFYTHSHLPNLTPSLEVFVLYVQALRPSRAPPIRCRLCHCRRIKQLMQYPPFSIPPIKGFVQKAFPHIKYSNTYLAHSLQIRATTFR